MHACTCIRMSKSEDSFLLKRFSVNSRRTFSTSAHSSGVPWSGSNSHTARPRKPFVDRSHRPPAPPPSDTLSLHMFC